MFKWKRKSFFNYDLEIKEQPVIKKEKVDLIDRDFEKMAADYNDDHFAREFASDAAFFPGDFDVEEMNEFGIGSYFPHELETHKVREPPKSDKIMKLLMFKNKRSPSNEIKNENTNDYSHKPSLNPSPTPGLFGKLHSPENCGNIFGNDSPKPACGTKTTPSQRRREAEGTNSETIRGTAKAKLSATVNKKFINEDGNFTCTLCPYNSKYITHFEMHMKHSHPGVPIFLCEICGFETKAKNYLTVHVMNHLGLKPYKCSECDYASPRKEYLDLHLKRHFKVYCFKCMHCAYTTYRQDYLARHISEKH